MKNYILAMMFFFFFTLTSYSQTITETTDIASGGWWIEKLIDGTTTDYLDGNYGIGRYLDGNVQHIYRTYFEISLYSIPTNATITKVEVSYSTDNKNYSFKLTNVTSLGETQGAQWNAIGNSNSFDTGIGYGTDKFTSTSIKSQMQSSLSSRGMVIGALSEDESANDSHSCISINLHVTYTRPAESLSYVAENYMDGYNGGYIGVGINTSSVTKYSSPKTFDINESLTMYLKAYDDNPVHNSHQYIFNDTEATASKSEWKKVKDGSVDAGNTALISREATIDEGGSTFQAYLKKECNITFAGPSYATIQINSTNYDYPATGFMRIEGNTITAKPNYVYDLNGINFYFDRWNDDSTILNRTFTPTSTTTYTAYYKGYASTSSMDVHFVGDPGDHITIDWDDHVSTDVTQYKVWRYPSTLLATLNRGTTTYTDRSNTFYDGSGTAINLHYAVTAYYSPDNTWSTQNWKNILGDDVPWNIKEEPIEEKSEELALVVEEEKELSLANHPNPFNPETIINYTNPENSLVTIKVYDMLGREVRTLVNEVKDAGNYSVRFNASNMPSGVYIYSIQTNKSTLSKKMILMK